MGNSSIGNRYLDTGIMFVLYLVYRLSNKLGYIEKSKNVIIWITPFAVITSFMTLKGLLNSPYLSRSIKTQGEHTMQLRSQGIGGYEFIYFLVFVCILLFYILLNHKEVELNKKQRLLLFSILILFLLTILYSNYLTALLMIAVSFSIILVMRIRNAIWKLLFLPIIFLMAVYSKSIFLVITDFVIQIVGSGATVEKLLILQQSIIGYNMQYSVFVPRVSTLESSFEAFLSNPLTGIIIESPWTKQGTAMGFGQHSYFIDTFALFGIIIGVINLILVLQPFIKRMKFKKLIGLNFGFLVSVLILFVMNNVTVSIGYVVFFVYPVIYDWLLNKKSKNSGSNINRSNYSQ
jgi:hypothetical protein